MSKDTSGSGVAGGSSELAHFHSFQQPLPQSYKAPQTSVATSVLIDVMNTSSKSDASQVTLTPSLGGQNNPQQSFSTSPSPSVPQSSSTPNQGSPEATVITVTTTATTVATTTQSSGGEATRFSAF